MSTTIKGLRKLIEICEIYGADHDITFNASKSFLQCFIPRAMDDGSRPSVVMSGVTLEWVECVKYLGYEISCWARDEAELIRRKRELYMQANLVCSRFRKCSESVKRYIFLTYFSNIYCNSLWQPINKSQLNTVKVAYNDSFRILFGYARSSSATQMFCSHRVPDFTAVQRRAAFSLLDRLAHTKNLILTNIFNSRIFLNSSLYQKWRNLLICSDDADFDTNMYITVINS